MEIIIIVTVFLILLGLLFRFVHKNYERLESPIILLLSYLSFAIAVVFIIILGKAYYFYIGEGMLDMGVTGQVGDFVGGVIGTLVTGISVVLLYKTLQEQKADSKNQAQQFIKSQIENKFFELLKFHRDNVAEIDFEYRENYEQTKSARGRHFFVIANKQLDIAFNEFEAYIKWKRCEISDIYEDEYLRSIKSNQTISNRKFNQIYLLAKIDICYLVIFLGVGENGINEIKEITKGKYKTSFITTLLEYFRLKPSKSSKYFIQWKELNDKNELFTNLEAFSQERKNNKLDINNDKISNPSKSEQTICYPDNYIKYYGGHQFRLGHYFRHLYQVVSFIHNNKDLQPEDKASYTRILRGQLSDYEQKLFFYNSLSQLGRVWELSDSSNNSIAPKNHLITKYKLLKSISNTILIDNLKPSQIYPLKNN